MLSFQVQHTTNIPCFFLPSLKNKWCGSSLFCTPRPRSRQEREREILSLLLYNWFSNCRAGFQRASSKLTLRFCCSSAKLRTARPAPRHISDLLTEYEPSGCLWSFGTGVLVVVPRITSSADKTTFSFHSRCGNLLEYLRCVTMVTSFKSTFKKLFFFSKACLKASVHVCVWENVTMSEHMGVCVCIFCAEWYNYVSIFPQYHFTLQLGNNMVILG